MSTTTKTDAVRVTVTPRVLGRAVAAAYCGVAVPTFDEWVKRGYVPVLDLPALAPRPGARRKDRFRRVVVLREDLDRFIESRPRLVRDPTTGQPRANTLDSINNDGHEMTPAG